MCAPMPSADSGIALTHRQPLPRWYWSVVIGCVLWIVLLAVFAPIPKPPQTADAPDRAGHNH